MLGSVGKRVVFDVTCHALSTDVPFDIGLHTRTHTLSHTQNSHTEHTHTHRRHLQGQRTLLHWAVMSQRSAQGADRGGRRRECVRRGTHTALDV